MNARTLLPSALAALFAVLPAACTTSLDVQVADPTPILKEVGRSDGQVRLALTNEGDQAWTFYGYSTDSPMYSQEVRTEQGWESRMMGWCGTGMGERALEPGSTIFFVVGSVPLGEPETRILVSLTSPDGTSRVVHSPAILPN